MDISFERTADDTVLIRIGGNWNIGSGLPSTDEFERRLEIKPLPARVVFDASELGDWDSSLLAFLSKLNAYCAQKLYRGRKTRASGRGPQAARTGFRRSGEKRRPNKSSHRAPFLTEVGEDVLDAGRSVGEMLAFIGEAAISFCKLMRGRARFRRSDLGLLIQECGVQALPIVSLISLLVGLILAFVGAVQLKLFGAQIYVADLVGIAMAREMGAMMTAIVMAGRTGAAFAAQLGTMEVNEEIDALKTLGISPMEFLVMPRMAGACPDASAPVPLFELHGDSGRRDSRRRLTRYFSHTLFPGDKGRPQPHAISPGPDKSSGVRRHGRTFRLSSRDAVQEKRIGCGRGCDLRGGDGHRVPSSSRTPYSP